MQGVIDGKHSSVSGITLLCMYKVVLYLVFGKDLKFGASAIFPIELLTTKQILIPILKTKKIISKSYYWCEKLISDGHTVIESSHDLTHTTYILSEP